MTLEAPGSGQPLLVLADRIHTEPHAAPVGALLVRSGRVAAVGHAADLRAMARDAHLLDLTGTTITPGLTDAHIHLTEWSFARLEADLAGAMSPQQAAALLIRSATGLRTGATAGWLRGRGWNANLWSGHAPHRTVLDEVVPDRPVALQSQDMHSLWVNTAALDAAGITRDTTAPPGGSIVRDAHGEPTGLLLESAGQLVTRCIPDATIDEARAAVRGGQAELHALGITGVHSFPGIHRKAPSPREVLHRMRQAGELRLRVLDHLPLDALDDAIRAGTRSGEGDEWLRTGALKMFLDGALGSGTAWMRQPYEDGGGAGMRVMEPDAFRDHVRRAAAAGIASTVHAIGDAAVDLALDTLSDPAVAVAAMPHRIEHVQCCGLDRLADAAAAGVVCSMQPSHLMTDWRTADRRWGRSRCRGVYAFASLLRHGTVLAFGSDAPVEPVDPRLGLAAAVHRTDRQGRPDGGWHADERIGVSDALRGYTVGPALAAGQAAPAGTLAVGAPADFVAWDRDPVGEPETLLEMRCVATIVDGSVVHTC